MYPKRMVLLILGLALLVTLTSLAPSACGGGGQEEAGTRSLPQGPKALRPGTYRPQEFEPSLSFRVGDGWTNVPPESSEFLAIQRGVMGGVYFF